MRYITYSTSIKTQSMKYLRYIINQDFDKRISRVKGLENNTHIDTPRGVSKYITEAISTDKIPDMSQANDIAKRYFYTIFYPIYTVFCNHCKAQADVTAIKKDLMKKRTSKMIDYMIYHLHFRFRSREENLKIISIVKEYIRETPLPFMAKRKLFQKIRNYENYNNFIPGMSCQKINEEIKKTMIELTKWYGENMHSKSMQPNSKKVMIKNIKTGEVKTFRSKYELKKTFKLYKASLKLFLEGRSRKYPDWRENLDETM